MSRSQFAFRLNRQYPTPVPLRLRAAFPGKSVDVEDIFRSKVREIMAGCGLFEAQTYSMVGPKDFETTGLDFTKAIKVANPMNIEEGYMRTMIIPSLLNVIQHNLNRQVENVFIFEIGKTYLPCLPGSFCRF